MDETDFTIEGRWLSLPARVRFRAGKLEATPEPLERALRERIEGGELVRLTPEGPSVRMSFDDPRTVYIAIRAEVNHGKLVAGARPAFPAIPQRSK